MEDLNGLRVFLRVAESRSFTAAASRLGLPEGAKVLNNCHGRIVGRSGNARRFYNSMALPEQQKVLMLQHLKEH